MRNALRVLRAVGVIAVLSACVAEITLAAHLYGDDSTALTYSRGLSALLCGIYASVHLALLLKRRITLPAAVLFYPLCVLLGALASYFSHGFGKGWAPLPPHEAFYVNMLGMCGLAAVATVCAFSCYRSIRTAGALS